jgi:tyrosinase
MPSPHRALTESNPQLRHRKSIAKLRPDQLDALREGFKEIQGLSDKNGFAFWAGKHGAPDYDCEHSSEETGYDNLFLPWHRAYLYQLELALQTKVPQCTLPWWDWPASRTSGGIPGSYEDIEGELNPLAGFSIPPLPGNPPNWPTNTWREPGDPELLPEASLIEEIVEQPNFDVFSEELEVRLHNGIHGWVGGTMQWQATAAYDPIFWAHHTMVDRIWSIWQGKHASRGPRHELWGEPLKGLGMTVGKVLDTTALGYDYAASTEHRDPEDE